MANKELKAALDKYFQTKKASEEDLTDVPHKVLMGRAAAKQEAVMRLPLEKQAYTDKLSKHIVKVFVKGKCPELEAYLKKEGGIVLNGNLLYDWVADQLRRPSVFVPQHTIQVTEALLEFCRANDISSIPMPMWAEGGNSFVIKSPSDLIRIIKKGIRATNGDTLTRFVLNKYAFIQAINDKVAYNLVPVIVFGLEDEEITSLSDTLFKGQQTVVIETLDKKFDEIVTNLNTKLQAAYAALKRVT
jgi:hypothetical protein